MKYVLLTILLITGIFTAYAQPPDNGAGGISIPATRAENPSTPESPRIFTVTPPKKDTPSYYPSYQVGGEKSNFSMIQKDEFVNRSSEYQKRVEVRERGESSEPFKGNQFFGEYRSNGKFVSVMARDFGYQDGDRIKVLVNGTVIISDIMLTNEFKPIQITLQPGFNKIDFEALNQGTSGPNTAEFRVYDDNEVLISSNQWNLATGFKATVMIVKE